MKLAILTHFPEENYGGILQATALCKYLEGCGHDVTLIRKTFRPTPLRRLLYWTLETLPFQNYRNIKGRRQKRKIGPKFLAKHNIRISDPVHSTEQLNSLISELDIETVIVGSDQVWRYSYINDGTFDAYFLNFDNRQSIRKIAYAASFGTATWEDPASVEFVTALIHDFDTITVREESGLRILEDTFNYGRAATVVDPTLILPVSRLFSHNNVETSVKTGEQTSILTYILDETPKKSNVIEKISESITSTNGVPAITSSVPNRGFQYWSVEKWLSEFSRTDYVITDSYHGMIFSIIFRKQFFVLMNALRGNDRFLNILTKLDLEGRIVDEFTEIQVDHIDYKEILSKLELLIRESREILDAALHAVE